MADQNCSSSSSPAPVIITSSVEHIKSDVDDSNSFSNSRESKNLVNKNFFPGDGNASCTSPSSQSNSKILFSDSTITSFSENRNGVSYTNEKDATEKSASFLRPSILSSGFSFSSKNVGTSKADSTFCLRSSKLILPASKFEDVSFTNTPKNALCSAILSSVKNEVSADSQNAEKNNSDNKKEEKSNKATLGIFSSNLKLTSNSSVNLTSKTSAITVPNFVFGQNLHERVTDSVRSANAKEETELENKSNGTSDMLFTSVLTCKEVKDSINNEKFSYSKDSSSLIEDAARCQEARANKRKYEEVHVTTGEENEQNIIQVNVKLFAFDNGSWIERGRGILRLNDKSNEESTSSRIVIRTVGSLRVVLNTKIWSGMSLNRASERSIRLTAIDPNGQGKIFLVQASLKDMSQLYPLIEDRIKLCKERELEESPQKKIALEKVKM